MATGNYVLGVSGLFHDSTAALVDGDRIVAAAQEERFTRRKGDWSFPSNAISYCLQHVPEDHQLTALAFYENPALKIDRIIKNTVNQAPRGAPLWPRTLIALNELNAKLPDLLQGVMDDPAKIHFTAHHRSHAASAFLPSPFDEAAVLVVDGVGEWSTTSIWHGEDSKLTPVSEIQFPDSLGLFYSAFTQYCGFKVNSGEYKLMGLAPFGQPVFQDKILNEIIDVKEDGSFALNLKYFEFHTGLSTISPLFGMLFGAPMRLPGETITQHFMDIAASAQAVTNEVMQRLARSALRQTGLDKLCMAGGVSLNCVANTSILHAVDELKDLWIQPASGDAGGALGAALQVAESLRPSTTRRLSGHDRMQNAFLRPDYAQAEIEAVLQRQELIFEIINDDDELCRCTAQALLDGQIVGHFDGRMEFGPRALGNRSILADPRPPGTLGRVNTKIKFREGWRPFAPIVLASHAAELFDEPSQSAYMLLVSHLKQELRDGPQFSAMRARGIHSLPQLQEAGPAAYSSVSHVDYSARIQTIDEGGLSRAGRILAAFHAATGCPLLMNTSFNVRGEPIVCSPEDAVGCFLNTHLDLLVIGQCLVRKSKQTPSMRRIVGRKNFDAD